MPEKTISTYSKGICIFVLFLHSAQINSSLWLASRWLWSITLQNTYGCISWKGGVYIWECIFLALHFGVFTVCIFRKAIYTPPPPHANLNVHPHLLVLIPPPPNLVSCSNLSSRHHLSLPGDFFLFCVLVSFCHGALNFNTHLNLTDWNLQCCHQRYTKWKWRWGSGFYRRAVCTFL